MSWYANASRAVVDLDAVVVDGVATTDVFRYAYGAGQALLSTRWARQGAKVNPVALRLAKADAQAGPIPADRVPLPSPGGSFQRDRLVVVEGGTVVLTDAVVSGTTLGYLVTETTTFSGEGGDSALAPGIYTLVRVDGGWLVGRANLTALGTPPEPDGQILDTFTMANGNLSGHIPDSGTASAWTNGSGMGFMAPETPAPPVVGNKIAMSGGTSYGGKIAVPHTTSTVAEFDYALTTGGGDSNVMFAFGDVDNYFYVSARQDGNILLYHAPSFTEYANLSGQPTTGRLTFSYIGNAITLKVNGTTVATGTRNLTLVDPQVALGSYGSAAVATVDNLAVISE